jgi:flagellar basal-body rod protein FlgB
MAIDDIPLMSLLKDRMGYLNHRQKLIAENVANADTPGYQPRDLKPFDKLVAAPGTIAADSGGLALARTNPMHIAAVTPTPGGPLSPSKSPDSETTLNGNSVVLEEEMMKMTETRSDYSTAVSLYQQSVTMLQTAIRKPS